MRGIVEKCSSEDQKQIAAADSAVVITLMSAALRSSGTDVSMQCKILMKVREKKQESSKKETDDGA